MLGVGVFDFFGNSIYEGRDYMFKKIKIYNNNGKFLFEEDGVKYDYLDPLKRGYLILLFLLERERL